MNLEEKRESLSMLATIVNTEEYIGEDLTPDDVDELSDADVEKFYEEYDNKRLDNAYATYCMLKLVFKYVIYKYLFS